jgi:hypothetical protein
METKVGERPNLDQETPTQIGDIMLCTYVLQEAVLHPALEYELLS